MSVAISTTPLYSSGPITFSSLRTNFQEPANPGKISASELLRILPTNNTNPIVPNCTENDAITTTQTNWKTQQFRYSIKRYDIIQSNTDQNTAGTPSANGINLDASVYWNNNLAKNIKKRIFIEGTCGNVSTGAYGASFNATAFNLQILVNGNIYGQGGTGALKSSGSGQGNNGGPALFVNSPSGGPVEIIVGGTARIWGGGAGGSRGAVGATGSSGQCTTYYNQNTGQDCNNCPGCSAGASSDNGCINNGICAQYFKGPTYYYYYRQCTYPQVFSVPGAPGGAGGGGGNGQGYTLTRTDSATLGQSEGPNSGSPGGCPTYGGNGFDGQRGSNGADWGTNSAGTDAFNGGTAGRAITGANYTVSGSTTNIRGLYQ
jgi:hypothetical protein